MAEDGGRKKKRLKDLGKNGISTVPKFLQPSVIRRQSSNCRTVISALIIVSAIAQILTLKRVNLWGTEL